MKKKATRIERREGFCESESPPLPSSSPPFFLSSLEEMGALGARREEEHGMERRHRKGQEFPSHPTHLGMGNAHAPNSLRAWGRSIIYSLEYLLGRGRGGRSLHHTLGLISIKFVFLLHCLLLDVIDVLDFSASLNHFSGKYNVSILVSFILKVEFFCNCKVRLYFNVDTFVSEFLFCWGRFSKNVRKILFFLAQQCEFFRHIHWIIFITICLKSHMSTFLCLRNEEHL